MYSEQIIGSAPTLEGAMRMKESYKKHFGYMDSELRVSAFDGQHFGKYLLRLVKK